MTPRRRLQARLHADQPRVLSRAERAARAADRAVLSVWKALTNAVKAGGMLADVQASVLAALVKLPVTVPAAVAPELSRAVALAHRDAAEAVFDSVPHNRLRDLLPPRLAPAGGPPFPRPFPPVLGPPGRPPNRPRLVGAGFPGDRPPARLTVGALFPPPTPDEVTRIVFNSNWAQRMGRLTRLAAPEAVAARVAVGVQQGMTQQQLAKLLRPAVQGVASSARRIARTEGLRVGHEAKQEAYDALGDLVVGYQVHAVLDSATRPEHRRRDGWIFYRDPKPGQRPMTDCPHPPLEADGTVAHNCRCYLTPVLRPL